MNPASRQDVQNAVDNMRNRIMERMVTKQDLTAISDMVKNLVILHQQSQQLLKQSEYQRSQLTRRVVSLETRISNFENEVRSLNLNISRATNQQPQQIIMPVQAEPNKQAFEQAAQYAYRPN